MRKRVLWVIPFLSLGCGGSVADSATRTDALDGGWVLTSFTYGPGEFVFPLDCIGETGQFVGTMWFNDHYVYSNGSRGTHDNWEIWWDPARFVSLTTGQTWVFTAGFNNHGIWWLDESGTMVAQTSHEFIPVVNETTGQHIRTEFKVRILLNALGEYKVDSISFTCSAKP